MTIVCALHQDGETWIGGDSRVEIDRRKLDCVQKWVMAPDGTQAIGIAGSARIIYLLERMGDDLFHKADVHTVCSTIRTAVFDDGWKIDPGTGEAPWADVSAVYVDAVAVWIIPTDWVPVEFPNGTMVAVGSGKWEALGAWHALAKRGERPEVMVRDALEAAVAFDDGCGGELFVRRIETSRIENAASAVLRDSGRSKRNTVARGDSLTRRSK